MSVSEILTELETLTADELNAVQDKIDLLRETTDPEELAIIEEGLRSSREERSYTIEEVRQEMKKWRFESK